MSTPYQISANGLVYTVVDDFTSSYRVLVTGSVTDETLGEFSAADFSVATGRADLTGKTTPQGLYAISGYVDRAFPKLPLTGYTVTVNMTAAGFRPVMLNVPIPQNASFPVPAANAVMRRMPVRVQGRVVADNAGRTPLAGARVISVDDPNTPPTTHAIALGSPLHFAHAPGTAVQEISLTVFDTAQLTANAAAGTRVVELSNRAGLVAGSILRLSKAAQTLLEYVLVDSLGPGSGAGRVTLRNPLNRTFGAGVATEVAFLTAGAVNASATLAVDADAGDGVLIATQPLAGPTLQIDGGSPATEFHDAGALTGLDGYYALDGVGRSRQLFFQASKAGFADLVQEWVLEYDQAVNVVDFRLHT